MLLSFISNDVVFVNSVRMSQPVRREVGKHDFLMCLVNAYHSVWRLRSKSVSMKISDFVGIFICNVKTH